MAAALRIVRFTSNNNLPIGSFVQSMLTEAQFQELNGTGWVLADGRSVTGSVYASVTGLTTLPDARGLVLRSKNNGRSDGNQNPDGELALGTFQDHAFASHNHGGGFHQHGSNPGGQRASALGSETCVEETFNNYRVVMEGPTVTVVQTQGGNENRMRNMTVNTFIKINP